MPKVLDYDAGTKDLEAPLTDEEKMLASLAMGTNAALVQFVLEGIVPPQEQLHFMMHLMDFTGKLFAGKDITFQGSGQTYRLNSEAGKLYAQAARDALNNGEDNAAKMKEALQNAVALQQQQDNEQTNNLEEGVVNVSKPTVH